MKLEVAVEYASSRIREKLELMCGVPSNMSQEEWCKSTTRLATGHRRANERELKGEVKRCEKKEQKVHPRERDLRNMFYMQVCKHTEGALWRAAVTLCTAGRRNL